MEHAVPTVGCIHALPGRLRVKVAAIKKAPAVASQLEQTLRQQRGVAEVVANPVTGSVLIRYDAEKTGPDAILARLTPYGSPPPTAPERPRSEFSQQLGKAVGKELVKLALAQMLPGSPVELLFALI